MARVRLLALIIVALTNCAILSSRLLAQSSPSLLNSIAKALSRPGKRLRLRGNSQSSILANIVTVPSEDGQNSLTLIWMVFPHDSVTVRACRVNKIGPANLLYDAYSPKGALVLLNGGFYGYDGAHMAGPLGLLISDGKRLS